ncbi:Uncharacterized protein APZ42_034226 [Daphnia magna]|uniref:Integrase catalytic domain-containing protein n=1 Tax=Daphnia magna TaxID=35525 RepID=A0A164KB06_9CRUS|nr:Uncharacterized protein APZ42_034226 [Daphnia magna]
MSHGKGVIIDALERSRRRAAEEAAKEIQTYYSGLRAATPLARSSTGLQAASAASARSKGRSRGPPEEVSDLILGQKGTWLSREVFLPREVPDPSQFQSDSEPQGEEFEDAQSYQDSRNPEAGSAVMEGAYESVPVVEADKPKTAFVTPDGLYQYRVMPFGLCSAPSPFQRLMDMVLAGLKWTDCLVFMDDVVIFAKGAKEHLERLGKVLWGFRKANLKLKMEKCAFGNERVGMLGHVVAYPLTVMEGKGFFRWGEPERNGFAVLKAALVKAAQFAHPDYSKNFEVHPDACDNGIRAALMQERNEHPMPFCFVSRLLNKSERNYTITEKECLAIVWAVKNFRPYIWGTKIVVKTDHHALCWLITKQELSGRLERWSLSLQEYDISIHYKKGSLHEDADALSRYPIQERGEEEQALAIPVAAIGLDTWSWANVQDRVKQWRRIKQVMIKNDSTQYGDFMLKEDLLYLRTIRFGQEFDRICVPPERRKEALSWVYDEPTTGQGGYPLCLKLQELSDPEAGSRKEEGADGDNTDVVARHGFPRELTSDQGKCFTSKVNRELLVLLRLSHCMTVPYHQQVNGLVEIENRTLATMLAMYVDESHEDWDEFLGFVTFAYNIARQERTNETLFMMVYGREAVIPADLLAVTRPSQPKLVGAEDLMKAMMELREDVKDRLAMVQQRQKTKYDARARVGAAPVYEPGHLVLIFCPQRKKGLAESGKKTLVLHVSQVKKFVVESEEESDRDEEVERLEHSDTDLDVKRADTDSGVVRADTSLEEAFAETEEGMACAETDTSETLEADTGVTTNNSTTAAAVEPAARREKGRMRRRPLEPIAKMDEGLQDGKDSVVPAATESPIGRPTRKKRAPGQIVQANEIRGKYVATEGAVFHPEDSLALGDTERVVIYNVPTKRAEQVIKLVITWVDDMARPAPDLAEIKARAERQREEFRELERALKGDGTRRRRGLFDGGGQLLNWLFGTATTKDLEFSTTVEKLAFGYLCTDMPASGYKS